MIDWQFGDSVADLRDKIATLRGMLQDAHRREYRLRALLEQTRANQKSEEQS